MLKEDIRSRKGGLLAVVIVSLAGASNAMATGPDVIVGDLPSVDSSYGGGTNAQGQAIHAYAVGTTSCNIGTSPLNWWTGGNVNEHPVIGQNMYRLDVANSRFLQIGQIWLKHGFTALQGTVCSASCSATAGTTLGVNCSDPYGAGLNGGQSGLGPKSEVNPSTGEYPYPWINNGTGSGAMFKRLQVRDTDLNLANNVYFVSGQYTNHDDAIAGNAFNNESYRRVTVSSFTVTTVDSTVRGVAVINAWRAHGGGVGVVDPNVNIYTVDVPNDARQQRLVGGASGQGAPTSTGIWCTGRAFVGVKVVQTAANQWRYEYAVENLNVDRGIQAFSIPLPAGATVLQAGFHDVDYHSGEPYALTDWTFSGGSGTATWQTQTYATNVNANALRWGTLYNFWIETNCSPTTGTISLPLFKPQQPNAPVGTPDVVTVSAAVPGTISGGSTPPANDDCASATTVTAGTVFFDTTNATSAGPDACLASGSALINKDVWYRYTSPNCTTPITLSTCGTGFDTKIAVYGNTCPTAAGTQLQCNDDSTVCGTGSLQSSLTFSSPPNTTYLIRVGGFGTAAGIGTLSISGECAPPPPPPPPANDPCAGAFWIAAGVAQTGSTGATGTQSAATLDGTASCGSSASTVDVWYKYRPLVSGTVIVSTCGSNYDSVLSASTGACGALTEIACNDDSSSCASNGLNSLISFPGVAGTTYYIRVSGFNGATGNYSILVTGGNGVVPPANDDCANRAGIGLGATPFSTLGATTDGAANALCNNGGFNQITNDIWYNHPSLCTGTLTVDTCSAASYDTRIAIYDGSVCTAPLVACNDNGACGSGRSSLSVPVVAGHSYMIRVGGTNGAAGTGTLTLACVAAPTCDPDVNQDGNVDQDDVTYLINVIGGGGNPTGIDPDFNHDGNTDQDDITALVNVVAGGNCP